MECIVWNGRISGNGRPIINAKRQRLPQREMLAESLGRRLGMYERAATICRNPLCVEPTHIVLVGTPEHFWSLVDVGRTEDCWPWTKGTVTDGYGRYQWNGGAVNAHRIAWETSRSPIPDGMSIDHLCRNRICQNPSHMEVVTPAVNSSRGSTRGERICANGHHVTGGNCSECRKASAARHTAKVKTGEHVPTLTKTHCLRGHDKMGEKQCRTCMREASARNYARRKAARGT